MHDGTSVTHVPWLMSGSLTRGVGENVPGIPDACATRNFTNQIWGLGQQIFNYSMPSHSLNHDDKWKLVIKRTLLNIFFWLHIRLSFAKCQPFFSGTNILITQEIPFQIFSSEISRSVPVTWRLPWGPFLSNLRPRIPLRTPQWSSLLPRTSCTYPDIISGSHFADNRV